MSNDIVLFEAKDGSFAMPVQVKGLYVQNLHKSLRESAARHPKNDEVWYNTARMAKGR